MGKNFGTSQGQSTITVNGAQATPTSWSDMVILTTVPTAASSGFGTLSVTVGGVNVGTSFQVGTNPPPTSLRISPSNVNMVIGGQQQFTVVDQNGSVRPEATWGVDNTSLASITSDYSPVLTALAAGSVTLTATVQGIQTQTVVAISASSSLPSGTPIWSVPAMTGFTPAGIFQATPTDYGPASYSVLQSSNGTQTLIQAVSPDGQIIGEGVLPSAYGGDSAPDGLGGLIVFGACNASTSTPLSMTDMVPNGASLWTVTLNSSTPGVCPASNPKIAIRQDGAVVIAPSLGVSPALMILDGLTGAKLQITPTIPPSSITDAYGTTNTCDCFTPVGPPIVDSDGSIYFEYSVREVSHYFVNSPVSSILWLMKIAPDGTTSNTQLSSSNVANLWPGTIIPDGQGGIVATWVVDNAVPPNATYPYQGAHVSAGVLNTYNLPNAPATIDRDLNTGLPKYLSLVLGENGTAFISYGINATSFTFASGVSSWNYNAATQTTVSLLSSVAGNSLLGKSTSNNVDTVVQFDPSGNVTTDSWSSTNILLTAQDVLLGSTASLGSQTAYQTSTIAWPNSTFPAQKMEGTQQALTKITVKVASVAEASVSSASVTTGVNDAISFWQGQRILLNWDNQIQSVPACAAGIHNCDIETNARSMFEPFFNTWGSGNLTANEARVRFEPANGIQIVFTQSVSGTAGTSVTKAKGFTFSHGYVHSNSNSAPVPVRENLIFISIQSPYVGYNSVVHEVGHVFSLEHVGQDDSNLMCGANGNFWDFLAWIPFISCSDPPTHHLTPSQIQQAQGASYKWQ